MLCPQLGDDSFPRSGLRTKILERKPTMSLHRWYLSLLMLFPPPRCRSRGAADRRAAGDRVTECSCASMGGRLCHVLAWPTGSTSRYRERRSWACGRMVSAPSFTCQRYAESNDSERACFRYNPWNASPRISAFAGTATGWRGGSTDIDAVDFRHRSDRAAFVRSVNQRYRCSEKIILCLSFSMH